MESRPGGASVVHIAGSRRLVAVTWDELVGIAPDAAYRSAPARDGVVDWFAVADVLAVVVGLIAEPPAFRKDRGFAVEVPANIGPAERLVVESWFTTGPAPMLDVVHGTLEGRAGWPFDVWAVNRGAALPFDLGVLREIDEMPRHSAKFRGRIAEDARVTLTQLPRAVRWRSPLATAALGLAARSSTALPPRPAESRGRGVVRWSGGAIEPRIAEA